MKKLPNIIFCVCILFASVDFAQNQIAKQTKAKAFIGKKAKNSNSVKKKPEIKQEDESSFACDLPANVTALALSQSEITLNCPTSVEECSVNKIIKVRTTAVEIGNEKYVYTVSAGKIIGEGANVEWDLSDVRPGSYTITAGISQPGFDGTVWDIYGQTQTKVVVVKECLHCE